MNPAVISALERFVVQTRELYPQLRDPFDPQWRSRCEIGAPWEDAAGKQWITWQPYAREPGNNDFQPLERALETTIHPDIKAYYGHYFSGGLEAQADEGHVSLLFLWNEADAAHLNENLIGHALAKRRARAELTIFFACTEPESELFLAVDNASGAVVLEQPGARPLRQVADNLAEFLNRLSPASPDLHPTRSTY